MIGTSTPLIVALFDVDTESFDSLCLGCSSHVAVGILFGRDHQQPCPGPCLGVLLATWIHWPTPRRQKSNATIQRTRFRGPGPVCWVDLTSFLIGVSFGGNPYSWRDVHVLAPLLIGGKCPISTQYGCEGGATVNSCRSVRIRGISLVGTIQPGQDCQTLSSSSSGRCPRICLSTCCCLCIRHDGQ